MHWRGNQEKQPEAQNLGIVLFALIFNVIFLAVSASRKRSYGAYRALAICQLGLDIFIMSCAVHYNGGIENSVVMLYIIPIIMSGTLLGRRAIYATGLSAALAYDLLLILDYKGIVVSQGIIAPQLHANTNYLVQTLLFVPAMLLTITAIIDFVARFIRERTELSIELRVLSAQRAETDAIIKTMGAALVAVDMQTTIKMVNDNFEELTGWERKEVIGANLDDILPLLDENGRRVKAEEHPLLQMLNAPPERQTPEVKHMSKYYFSRKDGSLFPFISSFSLIRLHGRTIGGTNVFEDATSTKKIQQLKTNFVTLASHQLKTPVGEIQGYVENMIQGITGPLTDKQRQYLLTIDEITIHCIKPSNLKSFYW
ncbi:hypothetical protein COY17_01920 [Candidatus Saccharibacteria bacterium CG_4_10_14_0_2_um_filter_52_9]|nr:MAG: hypothetical protein COY17_01920 [Candidatus Saccharibacteria bacterium CG_4_10_14_0_2_um_filter_52_9]